MAALEASVAAPSRPASATRGVARRGGGRREKAAAGQEGAAKRRRPRRPAERRRRRPRSAPAKKVAPASRPDPPDGRDRSTAQLSCRTSTRCCTPRRGSPRARSSTTTPHRAGDADPRRRPLRHPAPLPQRGRRAKLLREALPEHRPDWVGRRRGPATAAATSATACSTPPRRWCGRPTSPRSSCTRRWRGPPTSRRRRWSCSTSTPGAGGDGRVRRGRLRPPRRARRHRARSFWPRRRGRRACSSTCRSTRPHTPRRRRVRARRGPADREGAPEAGRHVTMTKAVRKARSSSTGARTAAQDHDRAPTRCGPGRADGVDAGHLGRGGGRGRRRDRSSSRPTDVLARVEEHGDLFAETPRSSSASRSTSARAAPTGEGEPP